MGGWSICGVSHWGSGIRRIILLGRCWKLAGLDSVYTLKSEEPLYEGLIRRKRLAQKHRHPFHGFCHALVSGRERQADEQVPFERIEVASRGQRHVRVFQNRLAVLAR